MCLYCHTFYLPLNSRVATYTQCLCYKGFKINARFSLLIRWQHNGAIGWDTNKGVLNLNPTYMKSN